MLHERFPDLLPLSERLYLTDSYDAVPSGDLHVIGWRIRDLCQQYDISGRMPHPIIAGDSGPL